MLVIRHRIWLRENDRDLVGLPKKSVDNPGAAFHYLIGDYSLEIRCRLQGNKFVGGKIIKVTEVTNAPDGYQVVKVEKQKT